MHVFLVSKLTQGDKGSKISEPLIFPARGAGDVDSCIINARKMQMISGNPPGDGWPVMVWFHPGMFHSGFAAQWDVSAMGIKHKVRVCVSIS